MGIEVMLAMFGTMVLLSAVPGPSDAAVVSRALTAGTRPAAAMVVGIITGDAVLLVAAVFSLGALAELLGRYAFGLQLVAALVLLWFGVNTLRASPTSAPTAPRRQLATGYLAGLLLTLSEPEALLFYLGLLPAFVDIENIRMREALTVLVLAALAIGCVKFTYVALAQHIGGLFHSPKARGRMNRAAGIVLTGLGVLLLTKTLAD